MAVILVASNFLVQFPVNDWFTFGALTYPLAFLVVDLANRGYGAGLARRVVAVGFVFGAPLSFVFAAANPAPHTPPDDILLVAARIAGASGAAFLAAQLLDVAIFDRLRNAAAWWSAPFVSSAVASVVDTYLFFALAFFATGVSWSTLAAGDLIAKGLMIFALLPPYRFVAGRVFAAA